MIHNWARKEHRDRELRFRFVLKFCRNSVWIGHVEWTCVLISIHTMLWMGNTIVYGPNGYPNRLQKKTSNLQNFQQKNKINSDTSNAVQPTILFIRIKSLILVGVPRDDTHEIGHKWWNFTFKYGRIATYHICLIDVSIVKLADN